MLIGIAAGIDAAWGEDRYERLREAGFNCLDYQMADTKNGPIYLMTEQQMRCALTKERELAEAAGVRIWQAHGPWQWPITDGLPGGREERLEKMQRSIRAAALLGASNWVVHPFMPCGIDDLKTGKAEQTREANISFFSELTNTAEEVGVTICLENMPFYDFSISKPDEVMDIVSAVNRDNFKMCLDTGHAVMFDEWQPSRAMLEFSEHIRALHIHDNNGKADSHNLPFRGIIDWQAFAAAIKSTGWQGALSLEAAPSAKTPSPAKEELYHAYASVVRAIADLAL